MLVAKIVPSEGHYSADRKQVWYQGSRSKPSDMLAMLSWQLDCSFWLQQRLLVWGQVTIPSCINYTLSYFKFSTILLDLQNIMYDIPCGYGLA